MRQPIQFALAYPERLPLEMPAVDFARMGSLNFGQLDRERYPCLNLVLQAGAHGGTYPAALAAADEEAVAAFLEGKLPFLDIPRLLADTLERHASTTSPSLEVILEADAWARDFAQAWVKDR
jgi:1-deoxy-D-xylulose-5-phosphate reductoisomerase